MEITTEERGRLIALMDEHDGKLTFDVLDGRLSVRSDWAQAQITEWRRGSDVGAEPTGPDRWQECQIDGTWYGQPCEHTLEQRARGGVVTW